MRGQGVLWPELPEARGWHRDGVVSDHAATRLSATAKRERTEAGSRSGAASEGDGQKLAATATGRRPRRVGDRRQETGGTLARAALQTALLRVATATILPPLMRAWAAFHPPVY